MEEKYNAIRKKINPLLRKINLELISVYNMDKPKVFVGIGIRVQNPYKKMVPLTFLIPCGNFCAWDSTYGWVPEAGCPIHDPED